MYKKSVPPEAPAQPRSRAALQIHAADNAGLLRPADVVIDKAEHVWLSERDSLRVLALLAHPHAPNDRLLAAALKLAGKLP